MKNNLKKKANYTILILIISSVLGILLISQLTNGVSACLPKPSASTNIPVSINGDVQADNWFAANGTGSGTQGDPYVMSGLDIDLSSGPQDVNGIYINGTDKYILIKQNSVNGVGVTGDPAGNVFGSGIYISNCSNVIIEMNNVTDNIFGVTLLNATSAKLEKNNLNDNSDSNLRIQMSNNTMIINNNLRNYHTLDNFGQPKPGFLLTENKETNMVGNTFILNKIGSVFTRDQIAFWNNATVGNYWLKDSDNSSNFADGVKWDSPVHIGNGNNDSMFDNKPLYLMVTPVLETQSMTYNVSDSSEQLAISWQPYYGKPNMTVSVNGTTIGGIISNSGNDRFYNINLTDYKINGEYNIKVQAVFSGASSPESNEITVNVVGFPENNPGNGTPNNTVPGYNSLLIVSILGITAMLIIKKKKI